MSEQKQRKYYKENEYVKIKQTGQRAKVMTVKPETLSVIVSVYGGDGFVSKELKLWEIDKIEHKYEAKGLDYAYFQVRDFHKAFNVPVADAPTFMGEERAKARMSWVEEEMNEFLEAETVVDQADAMIDLIYFALGTLVEIGVRPQPVMDLVQQANMSKLWEDELPRFREEDGKIIKPANWVAPESKIEEEVMRQANKK